MYYILYQNGQILSINNGDAPSELEEGVLLRIISQSEYNILTNQFPNLVNNPYFALVQGNKVISFNNAPFPKELPEGIILREISEADYTQFMDKFSFHYSIDSENNIVVNDDSKIREEKIKEAIDYKEIQVQKIYIRFNETEQVVWFSKQRQHELWMEATLKANFLANNSEGCYGDGSDRIYINEIDSYLRLSRVIDWIERLSCYTGTIEQILRTHIGHIKTKDLETVRGYNIAELYPEPLTFNF